MTEHYASDAAHSAAVGAAGDTAGFRETIESDMPKTLSALIADEKTPAAEYDRTSKGDETEETTKQSVKYKLKESMQLDQTTSENSVDR